MGWRLIDIMSISDKDIENLINEIKSEMIFRPIGPVEETWNHSLTTTIRIIKEYQKGTGIFQNIKTYIHKKIL